MSTEEWEKEKKTVTLTNGEWSKLTTFLLISTDFRKNEAAAWEKCSKELDENGNPKFKNAASNADFWSEMNTELETIRKAIDA